jgi:hypothetical protein
MRTPPIGMSVFLKCFHSLQFPVRSTNNVRALTNWENRSRYLLHEIIKLQNYCDILEKAIAKGEKESTKATTPSP